LEGSLNLGELLIDPILVKSKWERAWRGENTVKMGARGPGNWGLYSSVWGGTFENKLGRIDSQLGRAAPLKVKAKAETRSLEGKKPEKTKCAGKEMYLQRRKRGLEKLPIDQKTAPGRFRAELTFWCT